MCSLGYVSLFICSAVVSSYIPVSRCLCQENPALRTLNTVNPSYQGTLCFHSYPKHYPASRGSNNSSKRVGEKGWLCLSLVASFMQLFCLRDKGVELLQENENENNILQCRPTFVCLYNYDELCWRLYPARRYSKEMCVVITWENRNCPFSFLTYLMFLT